MTFYGFPKANVGVMPECAASVKVKVKYRGQNEFCSPDAFSIALLWGLLRDEDDVVAYVETDVPL